MRLVPMLFGADVRARFAALPVFAVVIPWQCSLLPPPVDTGPIGPSASRPKQEQVAHRVVVAPPPTPPEPMITLPDEVVVKVMGISQQAFLRCWARAQRADPAPIANKVRLHLEIDEHGRVTASRSDSDSPALARCLAVVARGLPFPAPGRPAVVELPLMF